MYKNLSLSNRNRLSLRDLRPGPLDIKVSRVLLKQFPTDLDQTSTNILKIPPSLEKDEIFYSFEVLTRRKIDPERLTQPQGFHRSVSSSPSYVNFTGFGTPLLRESSIHKYIYN